MLNRRRALALGLAALAAPPAWSASRRPLIVNALGGLSDPNLNLGETSPFLRDGAGLGVDERVLADARAAGLCAVNVTLGYVAGPGDPHLQTLDAIARWDRLIAANPAAVLKVTRVADFARARASRRVGVI